MSIPIGCADNSKTDFLTPAFTQNINHGRKKNAKLSSMAVTLTLGSIRQYKYVI
jgi:hypothetical protein